MCGCGTRQPAGQPRSRTTGRPQSVEVERRRARDATIETRRVNDAQQSGWYTAARAQASLCPRLPPRPSVPAAQSLCTSSPYKYTHIPSPPSHFRRIFSEASQKILPVLSLSVSPHREHASPCRPYCCWPWPRPRSKSRHNAVPWCFSWRRACHRRSRGWCARCSRSS